MRSVEWRVIFPPTPDPRPSFRISKLGFFTGDNREQVWSDEGRVSRGKAPVSLPSVLVTRHSSLDLSVASCEEVTGDEETDKTIEAASAERRFPSRAKRKCPLKEDSDDLLDE